jgi:hypothetical protein
MTILTSEQAQDVVDYILATYNDFLKTNPKRAETFKLCTGLGSYQTYNLSQEVFVDLSLEYIFPYISNPNNIIWAVYSPNTELIAKFYGNDAEINARVFFTGYCSEFCYISKIHKDY